MSESIKSHFQIMSKYNIQIVTLNLKVENHVIYILKTYHIHLLASDKQNMVKTEFTIEKVQIIAKHKRH